MLEVQNQYLAECQADKMKPNNVDWPSSEESEEEEEEQLAAEQQEDEVKPEKSPESCNKT